MHSMTVSTRLTQYPAATRVLARFNPIRKIHGPRGPVALANEAVFGNPPAASASQVGARKAPACQSPNQISYRGKS
jgi:hypothetical protein